jgi:hypothetical protein
MREYDRTRSSRGVCDVIAVSRHWAKSVLSATNFKKYWHPAIVSKYFVAVAFIESVRCSIIMYVTVRYSNCVYAAICCVFRYFKHNGNVVN